MTQKIYPMNPIHETTTVSGHKAWVAFYVQGSTYPWRGMLEVVAFERWSENGRSLQGSLCDLTSLPEIPAEAREPKPGEVWEAKGGFPVLVVELRPSVGRIEVLSRKSQTYEMNNDGLIRPWPSDKPHGFEGLIEAILQAHGEKT